LSRSREAAETARYARDRSGPGGQEFHAGLALMGFPCKAWSPGRNRYSSSPSAMASRIVCSKALYRHPRQGRVAAGL